MMNAIVLAVLLCLFFLYHFYRIITAPPRPLPRQDLPSLDRTYPLVSFLVPAWNDRRHIEAFILAFNELSYPHKELLLCAGGDDGSLEYAQQFSSPIVTVLEQAPGEGKQRALRKSYPLTHGDIIYLTDIDCRLSDDVVYHMIHTLLDTGCTVTGTSDPLPIQRDNPLVQMEWAVDRATEPYSLTQTRGILGRNAAISKSILDSVGAFDEDTPTGTDYFLAKKLLQHHHTIWFVPYARIPSEYPETLGIYMRKQSRWIRNVLVLGKKFHENDDVWASLKTMAIPLVTILWIITGLVTILMHSQWDLTVAFVILILVAHPMLSRIRYLRLSNLPVRITGVWWHFAGTSLASMRAAGQVVRKSWEW